MAVGKCADLFLVDSRRLELVGGEYSPADVLATVGLRGAVDLSLIHISVVRSSQLSYGPITTKGVYPLT